VHGWIARRDAPGAFPSAAWFGIPRRVTVADKIFESTDIGIAR
jgi:hypothetical protein